MIDDAEEQARRYLAQAKAEADRATEGRLTELSDLIDTLLGQATSLRSEAERLQAALEEARSRFDLGEPPKPTPEPAEGELPREADLSREAELPREAQVPRLRAIGGGSGTQGQGQSAAARSDSAGARLLATQMAVSGSSREEIEVRLRKGFKIEDTKAILDAILGPEE